MDSNLCVGFSSSTGFLGWLIRVFTEAPTNHAFLCWYDVHLGPVVLGANANGVTLDTWENFTTTRSVDSIWRPKDGYPSLWAGLEKLKNDIGKKYDLSGLVGMGPVAVARMFHTQFPNLTANKDELFCSEFAVMVIRAAGYLFLGDQPADTIDPGLLRATIMRRDDFQQGVLA